MKVQGMVIFASHNDMAEEKKVRLFPIFVRHGRSPKRFKAGYINRQGHEVVEPIYDNAHPFREGIGSLKVNGLYAAINSDGQFLSEPYRKLA